MEELARRASAAGVLGVISGNFNDFNDYLGIRIDIQIEKQHETSKSSFLTNKEGRGGIQIHIIIYIHRILLCR